MERHRSNTQVCLACPIPLRIIDASSEIELVSESVVSDWLKIQVAPRTIQGIQEVALTRVPCLRTAVCSPNLHLVSSSTGLPQSGEKKNFCHVQAKVR